MAWLCLQALEEATASSLPAFPCLSYQDQVYANTLLGSWSAPSSAYLLSHPYTECITSPPLVVLLHTCMIGSHRGPYDQPDLADGC